MSIDAVTRRVREVIRATEAEARMERNCIAALRDGGHPAEYITRRDANATQLEAAVLHLNAALAALEES